MSKDKNEKEAPSISGFIDMHCNTIRDAYQLKPEFGKKLMYSTLSMVSGDQFNKAKNIAATVSPEYRGIADKVVESLDKLREVNRDPDAEIYTYVSCILEASSPNNIKGSGLKK
jgi:hypothetical protein